MKDPAACYPQSALSEAVRIMWERNCGFVPIVKSETDASVVGVITDRDACMAACSRSRTSHETYIERACGKPVVQESALGTLVTAVSQPRQLQASTTR